MPTDLSGDQDLIARIHDWLMSLWTDPEAAAQFAENPAVSLASNNLSQDSLNQVNLRHIAGDVANAPGLPDGGRHVLNSFANSPSSHSSGTREVFHVTQEVHHDNPIIQKIFQDNSVHIDNSQTLINNGIIDGSVDQSNNSSTAIGHGAVSASGGSDVNAATGDGSVANQGDGTVNEASGHGQVISGSDVGQNSSNSAGSVQVGDDANGAVNTGAVHGTQAGGGATGNVTGDGNETATVGASAGGTQQENGHFGEGADGGRPHDGQPHDNGQPQDGQPQDDGQPHDGPVNIPEVGGPQVQAAGDQPHDGGQPHDGQPAPDPTHGDSQPHDGGLGFGQGAAEPPAAAAGDPTTPPADGSGDGHPLAAVATHPTAAAEVPTHPVTSEPDALPEPDGHHADASAHLQPVVHEPLHVDDQAHHVDDTVLHS